MEKYLSQKSLGEEKMLNSLKIVIFVEILVLFFPPNVTSFHLISTMTNLHFHGHLTLVTERIYEA